MRLRYMWFHGHWRWCLVVNNRIALTFGPREDLAYAIDTVCALHGRGYSVPRVAVSLRDPVRWSWMNIA